MMESSMRPVQVWGLPNCIRCIALMSGLKKMGIQFEHFNMNDARTGEMPRSQWEIGKNFLVFLADGPTRPVRGQPAQVNAEAPQVYDPNIKEWWTRDIITELSKPGYKIAQSEVIVPVEAFEHYREGKPLAEQYKKKLSLPEFLWEIAENAGYCPCEPAKTEDTKCPCKNFREQGECICGLWMDNSQEK